MRMSAVAKSSSEWHRRMTAQNLGQNGKKIEIEKYTPARQLKQREKDVKQNTWIIMQDQPP